MDLAAKVVARKYLIFQIKLCHPSLKDAVLDTLYFALSRPKTGCKKKKKRIPIEKVVLRHLFGIEYAF
jgi:hypothetical protein